VTLTPHPLLVPRSKRQSRAIPLLSLRAFMACKEGKTYLLYVERTILCNVKEYVASRQMTKVDRIKKIVK
jgi:hypothetical protein